MENKETINNYYNNNNNNNNGTADKYRANYLNLEDPSVHWRYGNPPSFQTVNHLFEHGRTKVWPEGSLEETVQNIMKTMEMEISHMTRLEDMKTMSPNKFKVFVNGREGVSGEETLKLGVINVFVKNSLPKEYHYFKGDDETFESAYALFKGCFPRGFAWEVIEVYSGPPLIAFKFRHWGYFEGPYKAHSPTGDLIQFYGLATLKVDSSMKVEECHVYYDPTELFGGLLKGKKIKPNNDNHLADSVSCPFSKLN